MTRGGGGVQTPPKKDDIIYEQPIVAIIALRAQVRWPFTILDGPTELLGSLYNIYLFYVVYKKGRYYCQG